MVEFNRGRSIKEQFTNYVKRAFGEFIAERIDDRLKTALAATPKKEDVLPTTQAEAEPRVTTTEDELRAFYIIKAILAGMIDTKRVTLRDAVRYCSILLDDSNRKPIVKLFFNNPQKLMIELTDNGDKTLHEIDNIDDIMNHSAIIQSTVKYRGTVHLAVSGVMRE